MLLKMVLCCALAKLGRVFSHYNNSSVILYAPKKIQKSYYRCDSKFHLDDLLELYDNSINYGIVLLSGKEYRCYLIEVTGSHIEYNLVDCDEVTLQKRQKKGGQSAQRFGRIREGKRNHYTKEVAEAIRQSYMINNDTECIIKGLIIGGVGVIKKEIIDQEIFQQYFSDKVLRVLNTTEIDDGTVHEVYTKCIDLISNFDMKLVNSALSELEDLITAASDLLEFGEANVMSHLSTYSLSKLIISDVQYEKLQCDVDRYDYNYEFVIVPDKLLEKYGSIVGIRYY